MSSSSSVPPQTRPVPPTVASSRTGQGMGDLFGPNRSGGGGGGHSGRSTFQPYSSPFDTLSSFDIPRDSRGMFAACRELAENSATHMAYVRLMSTLPVTDLVFKPTRPTSDALKKRGVASPGSPVSSDSAAVAKFSELALHHWQLRRICQEMARSFFTYSNAVAVISYPFSKMLGCTNCGEKREALYEKWELRSQGRFRWKCPCCGHVGDANVVDHFTPVPEDVRLIVLDMEQIDAIKNEFRGTIDLYYEIPQSTIERFKSSPLDKEFICQTPQAYLEAALGKSRYPAFNDIRPRVKLRREQCFFMRAATLPRSAEGFAYPEMASTFQDYWLRKTQQKSQEAIHTEMAIPKRFVFPENYGQSDSLMNLVNLSQVQHKLREEFAKMRRDPGYVGVAPFKVGQSLIGGEAKGLSLAQDVKVQVEMEAAGLGVPIEALFGGLQYSGASVSLKQVESRFEDFRNNLLDLCRWYIKEVSLQMRLPSVGVELKPFRMGEDIPYIQMLSSLYAQGAASLRHLHTALNVDTETEREQIRADAEFRADMGKIQGKADAAAQGEAIVRGAAASAQGEVAGMEAQLDARVELARKVREDEDLYALVTSDPQLAAQILGAASVEASMLGATPDMGQAVQGAQMSPDQVQQGIDQYDQPQQGQALGEQAVENSQPAYGGGGA